MSGGSCSTARRCRAGAALAGPDLAGTAGLRPLGGARLEIFYSLAPGAYR